MGLSSRVGVRKCGLAVLVAGLLVLLAGCSNAAPAPTVVSVRCTDYGSRGAIVGGEFFLAYETYYWSDGTKTAEGLKVAC